MRYIDLDLLVGRADTQPLIDAANAARQAIQAAPDAAARRALIAANRDKWVAFRPLMQQIFGDKCWYTESKNPGTDDDIDHYRPKSRIADRRGHGGYWWEALHWRNFRLSCHRANRLRRNPDTDQTHGKGDRFPLLVEADRWMAPGDACHERPTLLDPTDPADPPILTFDTDGRVALSPTVAAHAGIALSGPSAAPVTGSATTPHARERSPDPNLDDLTLNLVLPALEAAGLEPLPPQGASDDEVEAWVERFIDASVQPAVTETEHGR